MTARREWRLHRVGGVVGVLVAPLLIGSAQVQERVFHFQTGQVLSLITSKPRPGQDAAREAYFARVFPMAAEHGFRSEGGFAILDVTAQDYVPTPYMSLFSWPSLAAQAASRAEPDWPALEASRAGIWEELRICQLVLDAAVELRFCADREYSLSLVWLDADHPGDFDRYLTGMRDTVASLRVRKLLEVRDVRYTSLAEPGVRPPDRVWITEWPSAEARESYLGSGAFAEHVDLFRTGVGRFERFGMRFDFGGAAHD